MKNKLLCYFSGLLLIAFITCFATGCASSSLVSNKSDDRLKGPYKKIFIAMNNNIRTAPFTGPWMDNIAKEFQDRNIQLKVYDIPDQDNDPLSLGPDSANNMIDKEINEFQPEVVMIIVLKKVEAYAGVQIGRPGSNGGTFDIKLFDVADSHTPIWRGKMHVWGEYGISLAVKKGTRTFISKLEQDNIISVKN